MKKLFHEFPYIMLALLMITYLCVHSPRLDSDLDPSYLMFGAMRPPLYPIFIWLLHWAGSYQFTLLIWAQGILTFIALLYARYWLKKNLQVSGLPVFLVCLWVILTISLHFQIGGVQPSGLAFPVFIYAFFLLIECFQKFNIKKLSYLALAVSVLVLTRLQFYYFYGIFGILCIWYLWQRVPFKRLMVGTLILFGSMLLTTVIDHGYHYVKHGFFGTAPYGGLMILVQALYLADNNAVSYFKSSKEKMYVQSMINARNAKNLNQDANLIINLKPTYYEYAYQVYSRNYVQIQRIIENTLNTSVENILGKKTHFESNAMAIDIDKTLISHELKKNLFFFFWKFVQCMEGVPLFLFFLILLFSLPFKIIKNKIREPDLSLIFLLMITIITFCNAAIIALCNPYIAGYFCYSQFMFYCLVAFLLSRIPFKKDSQCQKFS